MVNNPNVGYEQDDPTRSLLDPSYAQGNNNVVQTEQDKLNKRIDKIKGLRDFLINSADSDIAAAYIQKPSATHDEYDIMIGRLNPDLKKKSDKYDQLGQQLSILENEKVNLAKAEELLHGAVNKQINAANEIADQGLKANAMERGLSQGAGQGLAGKLGATGGQVAAVQSEIANKFAPQRSTIENQRQTAIAAAGNQEFGIPAQLQGIESQKATDEYNRELTRGLKSKVSSTYSTP